MAQLLSPGVFIEEVPSTLNVVGPVSTSNMGIVGWTPQGPTNVATYITSFNQFVQTFGTFDSRSLVAYAMAAFYFNGGTASYVVRVTPTDAAVATGTVLGVHTEQQIETGDGATQTYSKTSGTTSLKVNAGASPIAVGAQPPTGPGLFIEYRALATTVSSAVAVQRNQATPLVEATGVLTYEGAIDPHQSVLFGTGIATSLFFRAVQPGTTGLSVAILTGSALSVAVAGSVINITIDTGVTIASAVVALVNADPVASLLVTAYDFDNGTGIVVVASSTPLAGGLPTYDENLDALLPGSLTITWSENNIAFTGLTTTPIQTATNGAGSTATLDLRTGRFSIAMNIADVPLVGNNGKPFELAYHPASATVALTADTTANAYGYVGVLGTTLTGSGNLTSSLTTPVPTSTQSWFNVNTGAYNLYFQAGAANLPANLARVVATYETTDWIFKPISAGAWGNSVSVQIQGSPNYFNTATQLYSRFIALVLTTNSLGVTSVAESYEDLVWNDPTNTLFFADVINEFSSLIMVQEPGGNEGPPQLNGIANSVVLCGGDDSNAGRIVTTTLPNAPVAPNTVTITYTDSLGVARTITDDGNGNLVGGVDPTYVGGSTINYTTGAVNFETVAVAGPAGIKSGTLVVAAYYTAPSEATDTIAFVGGSDGTFDSTHFSRAQFSSPALSADYDGLYALSRVEDLMQVIIPDFAGDVTVTDDLLDYADARAAQPCGGDRFVVLTTPQGLSSQQAVNWFRNTLGRYSDYAALYWPWVNIADPITGRTKTMPGVGHVCGVYARTDSTRNVGKSPGGTVDGQLQFVTSLESSPTQGDRDLVYPNKINPFISSPQTGIAVWGVRTIAIDPQWLYINARRLFMFLEKSIFNATFWIVFENNGPALWARVQGQIQGFLNNLFNNGYFAGTTPSQAYFVICDNTNNTADSINAGQVIIDVGIAPNKPAEFVVFRFQQITSG